MRMGGAIAGVVGAVALAGCGGSGAGPGGASSGAAGSGSGSGSRYQVAVSGRFAAHQSLARHTQLAITVRNTGRHALPDVAVTICNRSCAPRARRNQGTSAAAFGHDITGAPDLANPSRPLWIVDRGPGACHFNCAAAGGTGGAGVTANSNTWALGRLAPGASVRFRWGLTPVVAGHHLVAWEVAGDLTGAARAVTASGAVPRGHFAVSVADRVPHLRVTASGQVVTTSG